MVPTALTPLMSTPLRRLIGAGETVSLITSVVLAMPAMLPPIVPPLRMTVSASTSPAIVPPEDVDAVDAVIAGDVGADRAAADGQHVVAVAAADGAGERAAGHEEPVVAVFQADGIRSDRRIADECLPFPEIVTTSFWLPANSEPTIVPPLTT